MNTTEHTARSASTQSTGLLAPLRGLLPSQGSGAPSPNTPTSFVVLGRWSLAVLASLCALAGVLAFASTPAQATKVLHKFESQITEVPAEGPPPVKEQVPSPGAIGEVEAMTVDAGELYLAEGGRVDEFNASSDAFVAQLLNAGGLGGFGRGIAFGRSTGETLMYLGVTSPVQGVGVYREGSCGTLECADLQGEEWTGAHTPNESFASEKGEGSGGVVGVAVDNSESSGDWAKGDVFVATSGTSPNQKIVDVFNPALAAVKGDEPAGVVTQLRGTPIAGTVGSTEEGEPFEGPRSVTVSGFNGDVLVVDERASGPVVDVFEPAGVGAGVGEYAFAGRLTPPASLRLKEAGQTPGFLAVTVDGSNDGSGGGDIYFGEDLGLRARGTGMGDRSVVFEFSPTGGFLGALTGQEQAGEGAEETEETIARSFQRVEALAVDPLTHRLYVGNTRTREGGVNHFGTVEVFGANEILPEVTPESPSAPVLEKGPHAWRIELKGTVNPENAGSATCAFTWGETPALGHLTPCTGTGEDEKDPVPDGTAPVAVHTTLTGLAPGTTYYYRVQATNANGTNAGEESQNLTFTTAGPSIGEASVSDVAATSSTFSGAINPDGKLTTYRFEYDTSPYGAGEAPHGVSVPSSAVSVDAGSKELPVSQHAQGLSSNTPYYYRLVAISELAQGVFEEFDGPDKTFSTQTGGSTTALLDGRSWELVSPANKHGALIFGLEKPFAAPVQASLDGNAVSYGAFTPTESSPAGYSTVEQVFSQRAVGAAGWSSHDISPPHPVPTGIIAGAEYQVFSDDLSSGLLEVSGPVDQAPLSGQASERTPYIADTSCGSAASGGECYLPLVSGKDGEDKDVPPGTVFGGEVVVGASPNMQSVVLRTSEQLTETPTEGHGELYEWSAGEPGFQRLQLISLLPEDEEGGAPVAGAELDIGNAPRELISSGVNPISADGSRVFWTTTDGALYMRDTVKGETVRLDVARPGVTGGGGGPLFETASVDGSKAFFTDGTRLTADASKRGADLYECAIVVVAGKDSCTLRDLTPEGAEGPSEVQNLVLGASEDGSYVYFVANGVLGSSVPAGVKRGACRGGGRSSVPCNLYVSHDGEVKFIATLSSEDELDWGGENNEHTISRLTARVSPDGRFAAFMSSRSLTGYDNRDVSSGKPDAEVYEYGAQTGSLVCASCDPTGAGPEGREGSTFSAPGAANLAAVAETIGGAYGGSSWVAANLPTGVRIGAFVESLYLPRMLSDGGRLFFNSSDGLVPLDKNGQEDVYEFEPAGVGSCSAGSAGFHGGVGGCVALISSGTSSGESGFLDASASGDDVFFLTGERLVTEDKDTALDVYDAHVCSATEPCAAGAASSPACVTADACRAAPSPQPSVFGAPSSATFAGAGNLASPPPAKPVVKKKTVKCAKGKTRNKRGKCVKKSKSKKKAKAKKSAHTDRRVPR